MELFNRSIQSVEELLGGLSPRIWPYDPSRCWKDTGRNELVMLREAAFELGGSGKPAVSFSCFTTDQGLVGEDEVWLFGPDLSEIREDSPFARIVLFSIQDVGEEDEAYRALQDIEFVRYHVHPDGYMVRALSEDSREQVRIRRSAVRDGISFRGVGFDYIRKFKTNENVRNVRVIFITRPDADYRALKDTARKVSDITRSLNTILEGIPTDCDSCGLKEICDEVEGMRELHFQKQGKKE
ncbi:MAG: carbon monoxide dehydrogenase [Clostridia bacterium]|nr:carbon monoxide dehydrogenase [Clostridia bacterium]